MKKNKIMTGTVVSDGMSKSAVVLVSRKIKHPLYGKVINRSTKFMIHDEKNEAKTGDKVEFTNSRPISKRKCWKLVRIVGRTAE